MTLSAPIKIKIDPSFTTYTTSTPEIVDKDVGNEFRAIVNYKVVEKTKSFTILKVEYVHVAETRRKI